MYVLSLLDAHRKILLKRSRCARPIEQIIAIHALNNHKTYTTINYPFEKTNTYDKEK